MLVTQRDSSVWSRTLKSDLKNFSLNQQEYVYCWVMPLIV